MLIAILWKLWHKIIDMLVPEIQQQELYFLKSSVFFTKATKHPRSNNWRTEEEKWMDEWLGSPEHQTTYPAM
jgi:hypothetical protein